MSHLDAGMLIAIVGATGTGKSTLSLDLAESLAQEGRGAQIVNADAMQLYRGMNIGTAKVPKEERRGIVHHQLDVLAVSDEATVAAYQKHARQTIDDIVGSGASVILVGGSGLYISSVLYDFCFPGRDDNIRKRLEDELQKHGTEVLYERLRAADPGSAEAIEPRNTRRLIRALEVLEVTGKPQHEGLPARPWRPAQLIGLFEERPQLTQRLDDRVNAMWKDGLLDEVRALIPQGIEHGPTASRAIGYAQVLQQLRGHISQEQAIAETQQLTRRYARRQTSWFKRYPSVTWIPAALEQKEKIDVARSVAAL